MSKLNIVFDKAAQENSWGDPDSVSGPGSNLYQTRIIRSWLPGLLVRYNIKRMLDAPCGDLFWVKELFPQFKQMAIHYTGADIASTVIKKNQDSFKDDSRDFKTLDLTKDTIPAVELVLTRDCFIHLSYYNIYLILKNYKKSGTRYLLVSTYTDKIRKNRDVNGFNLDGRALNMEKFPFNFPIPIDIINEGCTEGGGAFSDKSLALWSIDQLNLSKIKTAVFLSFIPTMIYRFALKVKNKIG